MQGEQMIADGGIGEYVPDGGEGGMSLSGIPRRPMRPAYAGVVSPSYDGLQVVDMGDDTPAADQPAVKQTPSAPPQGFGKKALVMPLGVGLLAGAFTFFMHRDRYGDEVAAKYAAGAGLGMALGTAAIGFFLGRVDSTMNRLVPQTSKIDPVA